MRTVEGKNGSVSFDGRSVTIEVRSNLGNKPMGRRVIALEDIETVDLVPPRGAYFGTFNVVPKGAPPKLGRSVHGRWNAVNSDTGITFRPKEQADLEALAAEIESARSASAAPTVDADRETLVAQLRQLGAMHHRGALDDQTFIAELHQLLPKL